MDKFTHFIGIDVSKDKLDLALLDSVGNHLASIEIKNSSKVLMVELEKLAKSQDIDLKTVFCCMEATGVYCRPMMIAATELQLVIGIEPAWRIRSNQFRRGKTDKTDAIRVADFALHYHLQIRRWKPEPDQLEKLRSLLAARESLIKCKKALMIPAKEAKKLECETEAQIRARHSDPVIKTIKNQLKVIDKEIDQLIKLDAEIRNKVELITSIPGVGKQTAIQLILHTRGFERFENAKQVACYCGVAPFEHQSGTSYRGRTRVSHKANKRLKRALHMAALAAIMHNRVIKAYFARKVAQGKHKMSVINAIRNKLLHMIFAILKRGTPYREFSESKENSVS